MTNAPSMQWSALVVNQGDWLRKSLALGGMSAKQMAEYLGVEPETVSRWINNKRKPDLRTLRLWAMRTGAPLSYLQTGMLPENPNGDGTTGHSGKLQIHNLHQVDFRRRELIAA